MMYQWLVFAHVLGVFGFLLAHGSAAAAVAFKLRGEHDIEHIRVLLDLSRGASAFANASLLVLLVAGIAAGFMGNWWGQYWIWAALGVLVLISIGMLAVGSGPLIRLRQAVQPELIPAKRASRPSPSPATEQQLATLLAGIHPMLITAIGGGGLAVILWLMLFKPF